MNPLFTPYPYSCSPSCSGRAWVWRRGVVYDIPDAIASYHHGLLRQVTNAFTKIATLGIYIAVYEGPAALPDGP